VTGIEMFRKILDRGEAGDNVGVLLRGVEQTDIRRGMALVAPGTATPHKTFKGQAYNPDEGRGRASHAVSEPDADNRAHLHRRRSGRRPHRREGRAAARGCRRRGAEADRPGRDGQGAALRDPRRRPHLGAGVVVEIIE
jgi:hypothetical protein